MFISIFLSIFEILKAASLELKDVGFDNLEDVFIAAGELQE
jgi:hypothetical protein